MYPAPFNYHRAGSLDEAIGMMSDIGESGRILAGGQSLIVLLKMRFDEPSDLVDIGRIPNLDRIDDSGSEVKIGALATHRRIAASALAKAIPIVGDCANGIADNQVRTRGTIGGSVASGDPNCDWPVLLHTLDAQIDCQGPNGNRTLDINGFVEDYFQTILQPGEIVKAIRFNKPAAGSGGAYCGFKRCAPAYPTVSVGVHFSLLDQQVKSARIAIGSAGPVARRAREAEAELEGKALDADRIAKCAEAAAASLDPVEDQRGTADFKRRVIVAVTQRAIGVAQRRANGETVKNAHEYY
jgi:carbon-monoxide dehydrogenase medium subunit